MDPLIVQAITAINSNKPLSAQSILVDYIKDNPLGIEGWSCLYSCLQKESDKKYCLERILKLDINNEHAISEIKKLKKGGYPSISFPIVTNLKIEIISAADKDDDLTKPYEEKPLPVYITKRIIKYHYPDDEKPSQPILRSKVHRLTFRNKSSLADVISKIDNDSAMYGNRLIIRGISITSYDFPKCFDAGCIPPRSLCNICEFFSSLECPILYDPSILEDVAPLFAQSKHRWQVNREHTNEIIDTIYNELKDHGRPLHYEIIGRIMKDRHPQYHLNANKIVHLMGWHPDKFEWVDSGVYRAR